MKKAGAAGLLILTIIMGLAGCGTAQKASAGRSAERWFNRKEWGRGLALTVHPSVDKKAFAEQYHKNPALWEAAFAFLRDHDLETIRPGKYPIMGDTLQASVTEGPPKEEEKAAWEAHRRSIDLQYVIRGREKMGLVPLSAAREVKPYDEKKDVANYSAGGVYYTAAPGTYFLFFPGDVHRPSIRVEGYDTVKKIVLKIRVME